VSDGSRSLDLILFHHTSFSSELSHKCDLCPSSNPTQFSASVLKEVKLLINGGMYRSLMLTF